MVPGNLPHRWQGPIGCNRTRSESPQTGFSWWHNAQGSPLTGFQLQQFLPIARTDRGHGVDRTIPAEQVDAREVPKIPEQSSDRVMMPMLGFEDRLRHALKGRLNSLSTEQVRWNGLWTAPLSNKGYKWLFASHGGRISGTSPRASTDAIAALPEQRKPGHCPSGEAPFLIQATAIAIEHSSSIYTRTSSTRVCLNRTPELFRAIHADRQRGNAYGNFAPTNRDNRES